MKTPAWLTAKVIVWLLAAAIVVGLAIFGPAACNRYLAEKKAGQIVRGQGKATLESMDVANSTAAETATAARATAAQARALADTVRAAPAGYSNDAALRAACAMKAYRTAPACLALQPKEVP